MDLYADAQTHAPELTGQTDVCVCNLFMARENLDSASEFDETASHASSTENASDPLLCCCCNTP